MKRRSLLTSLALSVSLFSPLVGCGGEVAEPDGPDLPEAPLPEEGPSEAREPVAAEELAASEQTVAQLGVAKWRMFEFGQSTVRIEGLSAQGQVVASARLELDLSGGESVSHLLDIASPTQARVLVGADMKAVGGDTQDATWLAFSRDVLIVPDGSEGTAAAVDISEFNLPTALEKGASASGEVRALATEEERKVYRGTLTCLLRFATEAYNSVDGRPGFCSYGYVRGRSTSVMKVWAYQNSEFSTRYIAIGFAGTRFPDLGDLYRDLSSQLPKTHTTPLGTSFSSPSFSVGSGWEARWDSQAIARTYSTSPSLKEWLNTEADRARGKYQLHITVAGHSLGAVTATLAGYDIAGFLAAEGVKHHVRVASFNSPGLGSSYARDAYQERLFTGCNLYQYRADRPCLTLSQMTRTYDPIQSVPLGFHHPVWQKSLNTRTVGSGSRAGQQLTYCPQYDATGSIWAGMGNHDLARWGSDITNMPGTHLDCMFRIP